MGLVKEEVLRLEVAVRHPALVRRLEAGRDLPREVRPSVFPFGAPTVCDNVQFS